MLVFYVNYVCRLFSTLPDDIFSVLFQLSFMTLNHTLLLSATILHKERSQLFPVDVYVVGTT